MKDIVKRVVNFFFGIIGLRLNRVPVEIIIKPAVDLIDLNKKLSDIMPMNTDEISIYVFSHKQAPLPQQNFFYGVSLGGKTIPGYTYSDSMTEPNIAHLNPNYSELSGIYSLWKSKKAPSIVGLAHYRRYLNVLPLHDGLNNYLSTTWGSAHSVIADTKQKIIISDILTRYDIILPRSVFFNRTVADKYQASHQNIGWNDFLAGLDELYGAQHHCLRDERRFFPGNMFIARREIFEKYCEELFPLLQSVYEQVGPIPLQGNVRYEPCRYPAYLAERFMVAFVNAHRLRYYEADTIFINDL